MRHFLAVSAIIVSILLCIFVAPNADASGLINPFGGKVILTKALQIQVLEATGFVCTVPGKTIQIIPAVSSFPKSYFIPAGIRNKNSGVAVAMGQSILGLYSGTIKTPIYCVNSASGVTKTVNLSTVTMFGTSK